jgi:hypothetical protein
MLPNFSKHIQGSSKITKGKGLKRSGGFTMKVDQSTDIVSLSDLQAIVRNIYNNQGKG